MKRIAAVALSLLAISMVLLSGCGQDKVVLNLFNWGDYIDRDLVTKFEQETGIKVNYETFDTNESMMAKLETGATQYDVLFPSDYVIEELINNGMLAKIDFSNIPNFQYIDDRFKNLVYDPNNEYSVPYFWGTLGIMYNKEMVTEPVDSWDILWDEKYSGQILMLDSIRDTIGAALIKLGYSQNTTNPDEIAEARDLLIQQRKLVNGYYVDEIKDMMINGDAALALNWSGSAMDIYWEGVDYVGYTVPKEGSNIWVDCMVIPSNSKHKKEAEMFINFMLDPDNSYQNTEFVGYTTPNKATLEIVRENYPEVFELDAYNPSEEKLDKCELFKYLGNKKEMYDQAWLEVRAK